MYTLNVGMVRQVIRAHKKTGHLQTDRSSGVATLCEPYHVNNTPEIGKRVLSAIVDSSGSLLCEERAYQELTSQQRTRWTCTSQSSFVIWPDPVPHTREKYAHIPHRLRIERQETHPWQRMQWARRRKREGFGEGQIAPSGTCNHRGHFE